MKKSSKIITIIIFSLLACGLVALFICLKVMPISTKEFLKHAWDWINEPLPVVGFSVLMILFFVWRIFISSSFGKKQIQEFKRQANETQEQFKTYKEYTEKRIAELEEIVNRSLVLIDFYKMRLKEVCESSPNAKIKKIGAKLDVEEEVNNETKAE